MVLMLAAGILVGAVLGLTGAGGGILAVPALMATQGWALPQAAPVALLAVVAGAALGTYEGWRRRLVRYRAAILMAACGLPFAALGARAAHILPASLLAGLFAAVMLIVAWRAWQGGGAKAADSANMDAVCRINPDTGRLRWTAASAAALAGVGAFTGFLTGLLGVGGGFVIVPALRRLSDLSMHAIVATSLMGIMLVGGGSVLAAGWHGAKLPPLQTAGFVLATALGMAAGRWAIRRLSPPLVLRGFAVLVAAVAAAMLWHAGQAVLA
ncbi:sulfite exporter TauE/SafE family protein [Chromobacterium sp. IIBBL 290-4]|uniref:sulfite exporter TauE/SafE family protein n=1 Tax=Chromobacterium sp. IIBBL 290-4 TaxID=2953890 RepID=UPI0020B87488|nr:sulfite exporter TauE/SafE family protein [Chromobacterium sp. IIBBL 290-4]UTH75852.1 sulfite exporter TauE/SafE family protein [Chromobacterium sp. IIBBL 290-4]